MRNTSTLLFILFLLNQSLSAQNISKFNQTFVSVNKNIVAIQNVRVVDGTGKAAKENQTVIIEDGKIKEIGDADKIKTPKKALIIEGKDKTVLPGFVNLHEHLFYPSGKGNYTHQGMSFPRLYLAGGATTIRTAGSMEPYADIELKKAIDKWELPGPEIFITGPYLEGHGLPIKQVKALKDGEDAAKMVNYWADEGATSFKVYMHITKDELKQTVTEAHKRGLKVTGHLCSVSFREAAELGIDNLEHGFFVATDFVKDKKENDCPSRNQVMESLLNTAVDSKEFKDLVKFLVDKNVAITSTLPVFETFTPGRPRITRAELEVLHPEFREQYLTSWSAIAGDKKSKWVELFKKEMEFEQAFVKAGGLLVTGTDPTGYGGVIAGFSNLHNIELLVESGFSFEESIKISTLNGAKHLGIEKRTGTLEKGKQADIILIDGNPVETPSVIRKVETVFKQGVGFNPQKLIDSVKGEVGLH